MAGVAGTHGLHTDAGGKNLRHEVIVPGFAAYLGYRTHFRDRLGWKAGAHLNWGLNTLITRVEGGFSSGRAGGALDGNATAAEKAGRPSASSRRAK